MRTSVRAVKHHLPCGVTQCYLPCYTGECTLYFYATQATRLVVD